MATKNKPVTSYLPQDLEDVLTEYCKSKGLVRDYNNGEQKPQLGTAIVQILESYFFGTKQEDNSPPQQTSELSELKDMVQALTTRVGTLESTIPSTVTSNGLTEPATIEGIEELKAHIHHQQQELDRIASLAASKASRDEALDYAEDILGRSFEEYSHQWQYHLEEEITHRFVTFFEFYGEGLSCPLPDGQNRGKESTAPSIVNSKGLSNEESTAPSTVEPEDTKNISDDTDTNDKTPQDDTGGELSQDDNPSEESTDISHPNPLSKKELADRWGCTPQTINNNLEKGAYHWNQYCLKKDPDKLIWDLEGKVFTPRIME